jgi:hypothetical protein
MKALMLVAMVVATGCVSNPAVDYTIELPPAKAAPTRDEVERAFLVVWDVGLKMQGTPRPEIEWQSCIEQPCAVALNFRFIGAPSTIAWAVFLPLDATKWTDEPRMSTTAFVRAMYEYRSYLMTDGPPMRAGNETAEEHELRQRLFAVGL